MLNHEVPARKIEVSIYSGDGIVTSGSVSTPHRRLSDALNSELSHLSLRDVTISTLTDPAMRLSAPSAIIPKSGIYLASDHGWSDHGAPDNPLDRDMMVIQREQHSLVVCCGPFILRGFAHLPPGGELSARLLAETVDFIPITEATLLSPSLTESLGGTLLVNRRRISSVLDGVSIPTHRLHEETSRTWR